MPDNRIHDVMVDLRATLRSSATLLAAIPPQSTINDHIRLFQIDLKDVNQWRTIDPWVVIDFPFAAGVRDFEACLSWRYRVHIHICSIAACNDEDDSAVLAFSQLVDGILKELEDSHQSTGSFRFSSIEQVSNVRRTVESLRDDEADIQESDALRHDYFDADYALSIG